MIEPTQANISIPGNVQDAPVMGAYLLSDQLTREFVMQLPNWGRVSQDLETVNVGQGISLKKYFFHYMNNYVRYVEVFIVKNQYMPQKNYPAWLDIAGNIKNTLPLQIDSLINTEINLDHLIKEEL